MKKKNSKISTIILVIVFFAGLSVMLYPVLSDWYNSAHQARLISDYQQKVSTLNDQDKIEKLKRAREYNIQLAALDFPLIEYEKVHGYESILDVTGNGVMGYLTIPNINVHLPICHGTSRDTLEKAVGHLQGSSLPIGGSNVHAVVSAHRGLPSATLFTDLDKVAEGDIFTINILDQVYTYEVEKIYIVQPEESQYLNIQKGSDLVTLTTCTPYGINTHRLLVRAHRIMTPGEDPEVEIKITSDAVRVDDMSVVPFFAAPLLAALFGWWFFGAKKKRKFPHSDPLSVLYDSGSGGRSQRREARNAKKQD